MVKWMDILRKAGWLNGIMLLTGCVCLAIPMYVQAESIDIDYRAGIESQGTMSWEDGAVLLSSEELRQIGEGLNQVRGAYKTSIGNALGTLGIYFDQSGQYSRRFPGPYEIAGFADQIAYGQYMDAIRNSQSVPAPYGGFLAEQAGASKAGWVNGKYIVGNGREQQSYYQDGQNDRKSGTVNPRYEVIYQVDCVPLELRHKHTDQTGSCYKYSEKTCTVEWNWNGDVTSAGYLDDGRQMFNVTFIGTHSYPGHTQQRETIVRVEDGTGSTASVVEGWVDYDLYGSYSLNCALDNWLMGYVNLSVEPDDRGGLIAQATLDRRKAKGFEQVGDKYVWFDQNGQEIGRGETCQVGNAGSFYLEMLLKEDTLVNTRCGGLVAIQGIRMK